MQGNEPERAFTDPATRFRPEEAVQTYTDPATRFKPNPASQLGPQRCFIAHKHRAVPLMPAPVQGAVHRVDDATAPDHFEILTYREIRSEVLAELGREPGEGPDLAGVLRKGFEGRVGVETKQDPRMAAIPVLEEVPVLLEPGSEKIRGLEAERDVLLRLAARIDREIGELRKAEKTQELKTV